MVNETTDFASLRMSGRRFEGVGMPVEALSELVAYRALLREVVRHLWLSRNQHRKRVPRGFLDSFDLRIRKVDEGSAIPVLERPIVSSSVLFQEADDLARARDLIEEAVAAVAEDAQLPEDFPQAALVQFNRFGQTLEDGEAIELRRPGASSGPLYTAAVRKKLILLRNTSYVKEVLCFGRVTTLQTGERKYFEFRTDGVTVRGKYEDVHFEELRDAMNSDGRGPTLRLTGVALVDRDDQLLQIDHIQDLRLISDDDPIAAYREAEQRLQFVVSHEDGWLDGAGKAITETARANSEYLLRALEDAGIPRPSIYPMEAGGVQFEWTIESFDISVDISPGGVRSLSVIDGEDASADLEIDNVSRDEIVERLREVL